MELQMLLTDRIKISLPTNKLVGQQQQDCVVTLSNALPWVRHYQVRWDQL